MSWLRFAHTTCLGLALCAGLLGCDPGPTDAAPTPNPNPAGNTPFAGVSRTEIKANLTAIKRAAETFKAAEGKWPADVQALVAAEYLKPDQSKDPWDRPYVLEAQGNAVKVLTYGADGKPGGQDADTDWDSGSSGLGTQGVPGN